ncbi:MAG: hypothetical protein ACXADH_06070 [Candidatus Kariarchaeaceae archaeon]|jgi:hypothetical protein
MDTFINIIYAVIGLVSFGCFIYILIKLFSEEGVWRGILGIICAIYTFIWGWMNIEDERIRNIMVVWSICIVIGLIIRFVS